MRKDTREENNVLLRLVDGNLEGVAVMGSRISLKPMSINSKFHERLTKTAAVAVEKKMQRIQVLSPQFFMSLLFNFEQSVRLFAYLFNSPLAYLIAHPLVCPFT